MKICSVAVDLFHVDGQTGRHDQANSRFWQFCENTKKIHSNLDGKFYQILWSLQMRHAN